MNSALLGHSDPNLIELIEDGGRRRRFLDLPVSDAKLRKVATACLWRGKAFSRRTLTHILSQGEYRRLAGAMLKAGLARDTAQGRELAHSGRAVLRRFMTRG